MEESYSRTFAITERWKDDSCGFAQWGKREKYQIPKPYKKQDPTPYTPVNNVLLSPL